MPFAPRRAAALAALVLLAAGCGGGDDDKKASSSSSTGSGSDAAAILSSIDANASANGPRDVQLDVTFATQGTPKDPQIAAFLSEPVTLKLEGSADTKAGKSDVTFTLAAGIVNVTGALRQDGDTGWLQLNGKWYTLPESSTSSTGQSAADPGRLVEAFGSPAKLVRDPRSEGTEEVEGVAADHVSGDVDVAALLKGLGGLAGSAASSGAPVDGAQLEQSIADAERSIDDATVDVWVGKDDHSLVRLASDIRGKLDADTQQSSGLTGFTVKVDLTSVPGETPTVEAPPSPAPLSELQSDLGSLLGGRPGTA